LISAGVNKCVTGTVGVIVGAAVEAGDVELADASGAGVVLGDVELADASDTAVALGDGICCRGCTADGKLQDRTAATRTIIANKMENCFMAFSFRFDYPSFSKRIQVYFRGIER